MNCYILTLFCTVPVYMKNEQWDAHVECTCVAFVQHVEDLYLLAGIAPPDIRRDVCVRMGRTKQMEQETHSLFGHIPGSHLKSRKDFLTSVKTSYFWGGSNSRFLVLVSVGAARSLDQPALKPSVIKRIRQMTLNT